MNKLLLPIAAVVLFALPATAGAAPCRDAKGRFAKCPPAAAAAPAMAPAKAGPCKDAKGKFIKCGTAAAAPAPAMKPAAAAPAMAPAMAPAKKGPCKDAKGKFIKC